MLFAALLALGQNTCTASTADPWLTPLGYQAKIADAVPLWLVYTISDAMRDEAKRRLSSAPAIELKRREVARFTGMRLLAETRRADGTPFVADWFRGRKPYLVRAVYPASNPVISVGWSSNRLIVVAAGMGCTPFRGEPLLVWLDHAPADVITWANADL